MLAANSEIMEKIETMSVGIILAIEKNRTFLM